jgi:hypothetical protein
MNNTLRAHYNTSPCKDCPDRHEKCHSACEKYLEYRKQIDEINKKRAQAQEAISYVKTQVIKTKKHLHSKWKGGTRYDD